MSFKFASTSGSITGGGYIYRDVSSAIAVAQAFDHNAPYTVMCWVRCDKFVTHSFTGATGNFVNSSPIFFVGAGGASQTSGSTSSLNRDFVTIAPDGELLVGCYVSGSVAGTYNSVQTGVRITVGVWVHIAIVRRTVTSIELYVNGNLAATITTATVAARLAGSALTSTMWTLRFGLGIIPAMATATSTSPSQLTRYLNGSIAHIKVWKVGLSAAEISAERAITVPKKVTGIYCYLPSRTTSGTVPTSGGDLNDESGSGYNFVKSSIAIYDVNPTGVKDPFLRFVGSLGFSHTNRRSIDRILTGELGFGGVFNPLIEKVIRLAGSLGFDRSVNRIKSMVLVLTASLGFIGNMQRGLVKRLTGSLGFNGQSLRGFTKRLTGSLGFQSTLNFLNQRLLVFKATLGFGGDMRRGLVRRLIGNLTFSHRLSFGRFKILAATLRFGGEVRRSYLKLLTASLGLSGGSQRSIVRRLAGSLSFVGESTIIKKGLILLSRTLKMGGDMRRGMFRRFTATLNFSGSFFRGRVMLLIGRLSFTHRLGRGLLRRLGGSLSFQGNFGRGLIMILRGNLRFSSALNYFSSKNLIIQVRRLIGYWREVIGLDGEIDE